MNLNLQKILFGKVSDASVNEKKRSADMAKKAIGNEKAYNIRTFAIFTSESPAFMEDAEDSEKNKYNKDAHRSLERELKKLHYLIVPVKGKYGGRYENSFIVFNISLNEVKYLSMKYLQDSFIFGDENDTQIWQVERSGEMPDKNTNPYVLKDTHKGFVELAEDEEDFFTRINADNFTFNIPFSIFDSVNEQIQKSIDENFDGYGKVVDTCMHSKPRFKEVLQRHLYGHICDTLEDAVEFTARTIRKKDKEMTDEEMDEAVEDVDKMEELSDSAKWENAYDEAISMGVDFDTDFFSKDYRQLKNLSDIRKKNKYNYQSPTGRDVDYSFYNKLRTIHQKRRQDSAKKVNDSENIYSDRYEEYSQDNDAWNIYLMLENNDGNFYTTLWDSLLKKAKRGVELDIDTLANSQVVKNQARKMRKDLNDIKREDGEPTVSLDSDKKGRYLFAEAMLRSVKDELEYHTNGK